MTTIDPHKKKSKEAPSSQTLTGKQAKQQQALGCKRDFNGSTEEVVNSSKRIILNVGGEKFETYVDTCTKHGRKTMLGGS